MTVVLKRAESKTVPRKSVFARHGRKGKGRK